MVVHFERDEPSEPAPIQHAQKPFEQELKREIVLIVVSQRTDSIHHIAVVFEHPFEHNINQQELQVVDEQVVVLVVIVLDDATAPDSNLEIVPQNHRQPEREKDDRLPQRLGLAINDSIRRFVGQQSFTHFVCFRARKGRRNQIRSICLFRSVLGTQCHLQGSRLMRCFGAVGICVGVLVVVGHFALFVRTQRIHAVPNGKANDWQYAGNHHKG
mmetsp:Transcript_45731/g.73198  ORF Transcript_45731/g.73198 Transcript_45731/m.73198 type:complete len:214 (+) Transcript_45731:55-696(+)